MIPRNKILRSTTHQWIENKEGQKLVVKKQKTRELKMCSYCDNSLIYIYMCY